MTFSKLRYEFDSRWEYLKLSCGAKAARVVLAHKTDVRVISGQPYLCDGNGRHDRFKIRCLKRRAGSSPVGSTI